MYEITIDNFTGPMDLLLHLVKESKMDILDIKLEVIIDEYLDYIRKMTEMNLNVASSYLVMSTELLEIKSKMLLPKAPEEKEEEDPKERLINRLILYDQYKKQVESFKKLEEERSNYYTKSPSSITEYQEKSGAQIDNVTLDDLVNAFKNFLEKIELEKPINTKITRKELSVEDSMVRIKEKLRVKGKVDFFDLFEVKTKEYVVVSFLAILEMAKKRELRIYQDNNFQKIMCEAIK